MVCIPYLLSIFAGGVLGCLDYECIYLSQGKADGEKKKSQEKAVPYFFQKERSFLVFYLL
jgi:hypothetical protein